MKYLLPLLMIFILLNGSIQATTLSIENEFIKAVVNNHDAKGRFALETTGGNPAHIEDDYKDLIYGKPLPWTSYSTLLINDTPFIFGHPDKRLERWANQTFSYLPIENQFVSDNRIISIGKNNTLTVTQILSFYRNPNTHLHDSIQIDYIITNTTSTKQSVGLRCLLDTKLGHNDGAPLRMGHFTISDELQIPKTKLMNYWQAFDHLSSPNIIAQGLLSDDLNSLTMPDHIHLANWGSLAEMPWNSPYEEGRSFKRKGETQQDTALALYMNPIDIQPSQSIAYKTVYGLGGLSLSAGDLSLGISAPSKRHITQKKPFLIMAYILNASGYDTHNIQTTFELSPNLSLIQGNLNEDVPLLQKDQQLQRPLLLALNNQQSESTYITLKVTSSTLPENTLTHTIHLLSPPSLSLSGPSTINITNETPYIRLPVTLHNNAQLPLEHLSISLPPSIKNSLAPFERSSKNLLSMQSHETLTFDWVIDSRKLPNNSSITLTATSELTPDTHHHISVIHPSTPPYLTLYNQQNAIHPTYLTLKLQTSQLKHIPHHITFPSQDLVFIDASPSDLDPLFTQNAPNELTFTPRNALSYVYIHFYLKKNLSTPIKLYQQQKPLDSLLF